MQRVYIIVYKQRHLREAEMTKASTHIRYHTMSI